MSIFDIIVFVMGILNIGIALKVKCNDTMINTIFLKLYPLFGGLFLMFYSLMNSGVIILNL